MSQRNIGVAVGVPEPYGRQLQRWREHFGDPNALAIVPHVTLLPPTLVGAADLPQIQAHLGSVAADWRAFEVALRGSATFRPISPVVFVPLVAGIGECEQLAERVRSGPLARPLRFPYHPHVTVAHDLPDAVLDAAGAKLIDYRARFTAAAFGLFEQGEDGVWRCRQEFCFPAPESGGD